MIQLTMERAGRRQAPAAARWRGQRRQVIRLWVPMFLVWLLLAPFALLLSPLLLIVFWAAGRLDVFHLTGAVLGLLAGLGGTRVDVDCPDALISIRIL